MFCLKMNSAWPGKAGWEGTRAEGEDKQTEVPGQDCSHSGVCRAWEARDGVS